MTMTAEKLANLIHMIELQHRQPGFHDILESHNLNIVDWGEMLGKLQLWYESLRQKESSKDISFSGLKEK